MIKSSDGKRGVSLPLLFILLLIALGVGAGAGIGGYIWFQGGSGEASRDTAELAPTLSLSDRQSDAEDTPDMPATEAVDAADDAPVATESPDTVDNANTSDDASDETVPSAALYRIVEDDSEARFKIDEILMGNEIVVVGTTQRVAGDVIIDFRNPVDSQLGTVAVNVRTIRTDNEFRDQAIRGEILESRDDAYEFVTFEPTSLINLSEGPVAVGDTVSFQIEGDLTVKDVTRTETFDVDVTVEAMDQIMGSATTQILWDDYNISINAPPQVAGVGDTVTLEIDFVAELVEEETDDS